MRSRNPATDSIKTDSSGNVVLTSKDAETVTKFSPTGGVLASYTVINLDQSGRLLIDRQQRNQVARALDIPLHRDGFLTRTLIPRTSREPD